MTYKINRTGSFHTRAQPGSPCGSREFKYEVEVLTGTLDKRHFVADHVDIDQSIVEFFQQHTIHGSCEQVCDRVGKLAAQWIDRSILGGAHMRVTIMGSAAITLADFATEFGNLKLKTRIG